MKKIRVRWHEVATYDQKFEVPDDFEPSAASVDTAFLRQHANYFNSETMTVSEPKVLEVEEIETVEPSAVLRAKVQAVIDALPTETERIESTVYWQADQALVLVGGETGYREQQSIIVHEPDYPYGDTLSAVVGEWSTGVRDTRVG